MLEGWNKNTVNRPAFHMGDQAKYGSCTIQQADETAQVDTTDCDNWTNRPPLQYSNQGCVSNDASGVWANSQGGVCKFIALLYLVIPTSILIFG